MTSAHVQSGECQRRLPGVRRGAGRSCSATWGTGAALRGAQFPWPGCGEPGAALGLSRRRVEAPCGKNPKPPRAVDRETAAETARPHRPPRAHRARSSRHRAMEIRQGRPRRDGSVALSSPWADNLDGSVGPTAVTRIVRLVAQVMSARPAHGQRPKPSARRSSSAGHARREARGDRPHGMTGSRWLTIEQPTPSSARLRCGPAKPAVDTTAAPLRGAGSTPPCRAPRTVRAAPNVPPRPTDRPRPSVHKRADAHGVASTVRRLRLGSVLRRLREAAGLSLRCLPAGRTVSRIKASDALSVIWPVVHRFG